MRFKPNDKRLIDSALRLWPTLAQQAGVRQTGWAYDALMVKDTSRYTRVALLMTQEGQPPLVLKQDIHPVDPVYFHKGFTQHLAIQEAYPAGIAHILAVDVKAQAMVLEYANGTALSDVLDHDDLAAQAEVLERVGAWLDGFHRATLGSTRRFQPKFTLAYLRRILEEAQRGDRAILEWDRFQACAGWMLDNAALWEGQETIAAQSHGDLHMRNVIVAEDRIWGIDFAPADTVPVGHDIGFLLADYAILRAPHDQIASGELLPRFASEAFFKGYKLRPATDPSVHLLLRHKLLAAWWGLPPDPATHDPAKARRWRKLQSLLPIVFEGVFG